MNNWEVIQGDCLEVMRSIPDGSIDACITDPPYGLGESSLSWDDKGYSRISEAWDSVVPTDWLGVVHRKLRQGGTLLCFGAWKTFEVLLNATNQSGYTRRGILVWDKVNTMPNITARGYQFTHEFVLYCTKGSGYAWNSEGQTRDILRHTWSQGERWHPTQKTVPLMRDLIARHSEIGATVLDPFTGSGTTGVACAIEGRRFIGIEQDAHYAEVARARIARASGQAVDIPRAVRPEKELPLFGAVEDAA